MCSVNGAELMNAEESFTAIILLVAALFDHYSHSRKVYNSYTAGMKPAKLAVVVLLVVSSFDPFSSS